MSGIPRVELREGPAPVWKVTAMKISLEQPHHAAAVEQLNEVAFGPDRYAKTVYRLRDGVARLPELCFVALGDSENDKGELLASLRFWPIAIGQKRRPAVLLGPLAVQPALRGRGHGKALMRHGIEQAHKLGHKLIVLVGDPEYYNPFGFTREQALALSLPGPVEERRFLALTLEPGALDRVSGMIGKPASAQAAAKKQKRA
ncbi:MAG: N-acetyltransferase [Rhodospirillales bacterium]